MVIPHQKSILREQMKESLKNVADREMRSGQLVDVLRNGATFEKVQFVSLFISFPEEISTQALAEYCWSKNMVVCVPEFLRHEPGQPIVFREWIQDGELEEIRPGIFHPKYGPLHRHEELDVVFVPGLAFTSDGLRLGRGKGFYDQLLSQSTAKSIGLCFSEQVLPEIPFEEHDRRVAEVISV